MKNKKILKFLKSNLTTNSFKCLLKSIELNKNYNIKLNPIKNKYKVFLKNFFIDIKKKYNIIKKKYKLNNTKYIVNKLNKNKLKLENLNFISDKLKKDILKKKYEIKINDENFYIYKNTKKLEKNDINLFITKKLLESLFNKNIQNIYIFYSNIKKKFQNNIIINSNNVNSGVTSSENYSYIFRREECRKVLIHELLHYINIELPFNIINKYKNIIKNTINYSKNSNTDFHLINETYIEILANIINVILFCIDINTDIFLNLLDVERYWSLYQNAKILKFMKIDNYEYSIDIKNKNKIIEKTNVISYYYNRSCFYYFFNDFLEYIYKIVNKDKNKYNNLIIKNYHSNNDFNGLINFYVKSINNKKYINTINKIIKIYSKDKNIFLKNTARMSAIELKI